MCTILIYIMNTRMCMMHRVRITKLGTTYIFFSAFLFSDYFNNLKPREVLLYRDNIPYSPRRKCSLYYYKYYSNYKY
jgi:hypothetical protein